MCRKDPSFEVELFVQAEPRAPAEWHLGGSSGRTSCGRNGSGSRGRANLVPSVGIAETTRPGTCDPDRAGAARP